MAKGQNRTCAGIIFLCSMISKELAIAEDPNFEIVPSIINTGDSFNVRCEVNSNQIGPFIIEKPNQEFCNYDCISDSGCVIAHHSCECDSQVIVDDVCEPNTQSIEFLVVSADESMDGQWVCLKGPEIVNQTNVQIYDQSSNPHMKGNFNTTEGTYEPYQCESIGGTPPPQFQWLIEIKNDVLDMTGNSTTEDGISTLQYIADKHHNGGNIVCVVLQIKEAGNRTDSHILIIMSPPTISQFAVNENTTSTVVSLRWFLNSTGGSTDILFTLWYMNDTTCEVTELYNHECHDGGFIYFDILYCQPNTSYYFILMAEGQLESLRSENMTTSGKSKESPLVNLNDVVISTDHFIAQWEYIPFHDMQVEITVCIEYWRETRRDSVFYPSKHFCYLPVTMTSVTVLGDFEEFTEYKIYLHVYENGYPGTAAGQQYETARYHSSDKQGFPTTSDIVAITIAAIFVFIVVVVIVLLYSGAINIIVCHKTLGKGEDDKRLGQSSIGRKGGEYEIPENQLQKPSVEASDDKTYEQLKEYCNIVPEDDINVTAT